MSGTSVKSGGNSGLDAASQLLQLIRGNSSTTTSQSNISQQGINYLIQQQLASNNGLAAISGATKSAGGYNSTTQTLLTNDLLTRTAGEAAKLQAGTTTTSKNNALLGSNGVLGGILAAGAKSLLGPTVNGLAAKTGVSNWGQDLADTLGLGKKAAAVDGTQLTDPGVDGGMVNSTDAFNSAAPTGDITGGLAASLADYGANMADTVAGSAGSDISSSAIDAGTSAVDNTVASSGSSIADAILG